MFKIPLIIGLLVLVEYSFALPPAFNATYKVSAKGLTLGYMNVSLNYNKQRYEYLKFSKTTGLANLFRGDKITDKASGTYSGDKIQPEEYTYEFKNKRSYKKEIIHFQSPTSVNGKYKDKSFSLKVPQDTLDRGSMELALARDISHGKHSFVYSLVDSGELKKYVFLYQGEEKLTVPAGEYISKKFIVERKETNRKTTIWTAEAIGYLPIKIEHIEKGTKIVTQLSSMVIGASKANNDRLANKTQLLDSLSDVALPN